MQRRHPTPDPTGPGQESVWAYPRPPRLERCDRRLRVLVGSTIVADTVRGWRVLETSHPPSYYLPLDDCDRSLLSPGAGTSWCEWKGSATYWNVTTPDGTIERAIWSYPSPSPGFEPIADHIACYPSVFDCFVDDERVTPQPGGFYGGWITSDVTGPFKGTPGTSWW